MKRVLCLKATAEQKSSLNTDGVKAAPIELLLGNTQTPIPEMELG